MSVIIVWQTILYCLFNLCTLLQIIALGNQVGCIFLWDLDSVDLTQLKSVFMGDFLLLTFVLLFCC